MLGDDAEQLRAEFLNLLGLNQDVGGLALDAAKRLVNHHAGMRQSGALALLPRDQQDGTHRGGHAGADGSNVWLNQLHGVIDGKAAGDLPAGGIQV